MGASTAYIFIGIGGHAVALDRTTGMEIWRQRLGSSAYVTISFDGHSVFAGCDGELFCLEPTTGEHLWHNRLKGLGKGLIAFGGSPEALVAGVLQEASEADTAAATAAAVAAAG